MLLEFARILNSSSFWSFLNWSFFLSNIKLSAVASAVNFVAFDTDFCTSAISSRVVFRNISFFWMSLRISKVLDTTVFPSFPNFNISASICSSSFLIAAVSSAVCNSSSPKRAISPLSLNIFSIGSLTLLPNSFLMFGPVSDRAVPTAWICSSGVILASLVALLIFLIPFSKLLNWFTISVEEVFGKNFCIKVLPTLSAFFNSWLNAVTESPSNPNFFWVASIAAPISFSTSSALLLLPSASK